MGLNATAFSIRVRSQRQLATTRCDCGRPAFGSSSLEQPPPRPPPSATLESVGRFYNRSELLEQRKGWKQEGRTVVFTNGCYDLLHPGHIRLLEQARSLGDRLILALNSDASVRRAKGPSRPLVPEAERSELALAIEAVDAVTLFDEDSP